MFLSRSLILAIGAGAGVSLAWSFYESAYLELIGQMIWRAGCKNYVQATVAAMGIALQSITSDKVFSEVAKAGGMIQVPGEEATVHIGNHFDCLLLKTAEDCNKSKSRHGIQCMWCDHTKGFGWDAKTMSSFGAGSCYIQTTDTEYGCPFLPASVFKPFADDLKILNITPMPLWEQATCMALLDADECNANDRCAQCTIPDNYGSRWRNSTSETISICGLKELLFVGGESGSGDAELGWCHRLNDVPKGAKNWLLVTKRVAEQEINFLTSQSTGGSGLSF